MTRSTHLTLDRAGSRRVRFAVAALVLIAVLPTQSPAGADPVTTTYECTGSSQNFFVPEGVTSVDVVAVGAPGGTLSTGPGTGGRGAQVTATVAVTPGTTLFVVVGCPASGRVGGFNGGGTANQTSDFVAGAGGGGASDIRTESGSLASRLLVAAGGGGEGGSAVQGSSTGGAGGDAGADGGNAALTSNSRGRAGTVSAGGAGGSATGDAFSSATTPPQAGGSGQLGIGGFGGAPGSSLPARGGGGGGGGLFGGGGGGGGGIQSSSQIFGGGGGGGGSSLVPAGGSVAVAPAGTPPSVTISYLPPLPECADGQDNDADAQTDFPADPGCTDADDDRELDPVGNDDFQDAELLMGSSDSATGSNVEASLQLGEPSHSNDNGSHSIWYRWTSPGSGTTIIELCGSDFDTVLAVYTGTAVNDLTLVTDNDESGDEDCGASNSRVTFEAIGDVTYQIAVDGYLDNTGSVSLTLREVDPPANDDFQDAELLTGSSDSATGSNVAASLEPGEPDHAGSGSHSIWYRWTAPATGSTIIELCGSSYDSVLAVYTGTTLDALIEVASNDDSGDEACGDLNSRVTFDATEGVTYHIAVDGYDGIDVETGSVSLSLAGPSGPADTVSPTVTVEKAGSQADPTSSSPVTFTATFSEAVSDFEAADVDLSASTTGGTLVATVTDSGDQQTYTVEVSGMSGDGDVIASVLAGAATDASGNPSETSTSADNTVAFTLPDTTAPTVTVEQGATQADPTSAEPVVFDVVFSEDVTGFDDPAADVALTAPAGAAATIGDAGDTDAATYTISVSGMTASGDITASVVAGAATDTSGNTSEASTSTDNTVAFQVAPVDPGPHTLSLSVAGPGGVRSDPEGIRCGRDCNQDYDAGTTVTLTAVARPGESFAGWAGACASAGSTPTCTVTIDADTEVSASFGSVPPVDLVELSVSLAGSGGGVVSDPTGILCGPDCTEAFAPGTSVTLTAEALPGASFTGWGGVCASAGTTPTCTLVLEADTAVFATFEGAPAPPETAVLSVTVAGGDVGGVRSAPEGIRCGTQCTQSYVAGTTVVLEAVTRRGGTFTGWGGECASAGTAPTCTLVIDVDTEVSATFAP